MIKQAAVKKGNKMWVGKRHSDCFYSMMASGVKPGGKPKEVQGFVTDENRFVDRAEAYVIAVACGQIKDRPGTTKILVSEDLY